MPTISLFQYGMSLKTVHDRGMNTIMSLSELQSIDQLKLFLDGTQSVAFMVPAAKNERHRQVEQVLIQFRYSLLGRADKGVVLRFLAKLSGYERDSK